MNKDKFEVIMESLAELIEDKNNRICVLEWQVKSLEAKIKEAEREAAEKSAKAAGVLCSIDPKA